MELKRTFALLALAALVAPATAGSIDGNAVIGGAVGGATGAAIGSAVGGREGAIVGGAIGGAAGVAIATDGKSEPKTVSQQVVIEKEVEYVEGKHDNGLHRGHHKNKHGHGHD